MSQWTERPEAVGYGGVLMDEARARPAQGTGGRPSQEGTLRSGPG